MRACRAFSAGSEGSFPSSSEVGVGDDDVSAGTGILGVGASGRRRLGLSSGLVLERSLLRRGLPGVLLLLGGADRGVESPGKGRRVILGAGGVGGEHGWLFSASLPRLLFIRRVSLGLGEA
jgi:hypothetical protein